MKDKKLLRVFIASPGDVQKERDMTIEVIKELNEQNPLLAGKGYKLKYLDWREAPPGAGPPEEVILRAFPVKTWDIFIGIFWKRFGTPTGMQEYEAGTEQELDLAYKSWEEKKRPRILIYRRVTPPPLLDELDTAQLEKLNNFKKKFESGGKYPLLCKEYKEPEEFKNLVRSHLIKIFEYMDNVVPPPPANFIGRQDIVEKFKKRLIPEKDNGDRDIAIYGLSGEGKTAVAYAIAHDPQVREHFRGGILWAPLGKNPDVEAVLGNCAAALGISLNEIRDAKTVEAKKRVILERIGDSPILMLIDDARKTSEAKSLKINCPQCAHFLTTLDEYVAHDFTRGAMPLSGLSEQDSLELLRLDLPNTVAKLQDKAAELVNAVNRLPQAILIMGNNLRRIDTRPLSHIKQELEEILSKGELSLDDVIKDSYDELDEDGRGILQYLSIFPPDPYSFSEDAALAVSGKTRYKDLDPLLNLRFLEFKEEFKEKEYSCRYILSNAVSIFAKRRSTKEIKKTARQRMVDFFVNYVKKHEKENVSIERERRNIVTSLEAAYEQDMKEALIEGVNAFFHYMETNGLYEEAEKQLKRAEEAGRASGDKKELPAALLHLGNVAYVHSKYEDAEKYYKESLELAGEIGEHTVIIDSHKGLGDVFGVHGEFSEQENHYKKAREIARETDPDNKDEIIDLLTCLGRMEDIRGNYDTAKDYFREAMKINAGDSTLINSKLYTDLGWVDAHLGDFKQAKEHWQMGLDLAMEINHKGTISFLHSNLGWVEDRWGNLEQAEKHFETSMKIAREIGHLNLIGVILTNMGAAKIHRGDYENAYKDLKEGLDIVKESGHVERTGVLLENLAIISCRLGNYEEAEKYLKKGLAVAQKGIIERVSALHTYLGELAIYQERYAKAEKQLQEGLERAQKIKNPERLGLVYKDLGVLADRQGNLEKAGEYLNRALDQANIINYRWLLGSIYNALGEHWYKKRDYRNALRDFNEALAIGKEIESRDMIAAAQRGLERIPPA